MFWKSIEKQFLPLNQILYSNWTQPLCLLGILALCGDNFVDISWNVLRFDTIVLSSDAIVLCIYPKLTGERHSFSVYYPCSVSKWYMGAICHFMLYFYWHFSSHWWNSCAQRSPVLQYFCIHFCTIRYHRVKILASSGSVSLGVASFWHLVLKELLVINNTSV